MMSMILLIAIALILLICMLAWFTLNRTDEPDDSEEPEEFPDEKFSDKDTGQHRDLYVCRICDDKDCACHPEDKKGAGE